MTVTDETRVNEARLEELMNQTLGMLTGAAVVAGMALGDRLGLYRALAEAEAPLTDGDLARSTGTHPRLVREWLDGQAAAGLVEYDADTDRYWMSIEAAMVLAVEESPALLVGASEVTHSWYLDIERIEEAFRGDGSFPWGDHDGRLFRGTGRFFRTSYRNYLTSAWIPALDGVAERLAAGGRVADVGCGVGFSSVLIAEAFPNATVTGFDFHQDSIELAKQHAAAADMDDRVQFVVSDAAAYEGLYDLIAFFDCFHDLGDPVSAARHAGTRLGEGGAVMLVEPFALDDRAANHRNPVGPMMYHGSTFLCIPNSLSQPGQRALGAQAGEARLRDVFEEAGYRHFRRAAETPFNIVYEAKP